MSKDQQNAIPTFIVTVNSHPAVYLFEFIYSLLRQNIYQWQCIFLVSDNTSKRNCGIINEYCFLDKRFTQLRVQDTIQTDKTVPQDIKRLSVETTILKKVKSLYYAYVDLFNLFDLNTANEIYHFILRNSQCSRVIVNSRKLILPGYYYSIVCLHQRIPENKNNMKNALIFLKRTNKQKTLNIITGYIAKPLYLIR